MNFSLDLLIKNARVLTLNDNDNILPKANIGISNKKIVFIADQILNEYDMTKAIELDVCGALVSPGLIDCHSHIIYAGSRSNEFAMRLDGESYEKIAKKGGGILSTVEATRKATPTELETASLKRLDIMLANGTTTLEIKSGYGLDIDNELKMLKVAEKLQKQHPISIISTFLGAHAIPKEFENNTEGYLDLIINHMLPLIKENNLAQFVDGFCESIAFDNNQIQRLFDAAKSYGFKLKLHAEQLSDQKGAKLAANMGATSVDHLEYLSDDDISDLSRNDTVAVLLPGAFYFLKEKKLPPVDKLLKANVPIAVATDSNPGSSPFLSLPLMMNMACILFGLTINKAWQAVTINAAKALDCHHKIGSIEIGKVADLIIWNTDDETEVVYNPTAVSAMKIIKHGALIDN